MKIEHVSSTSLKAAQYCQFLYFLQYDLRLKTSSGKAAVIGNIIHSSLELMAKLKIKNKFYIHPLEILSLYWDFYSKRNPWHNLKKINRLGESADYKKCKKYIMDIFNNKDYNPYNVNILDFENLFDISFPGDKWKTKNGKNLNLKGFIDLVKIIDKETIEIVDWKTGSRGGPFNKNEIDIDSLHKNIQTRLYHLAAYFIYKNFKKIILTFYYVADGGPITICLTEDDIPITIQSIYNNFKQIEKTKVIKRNRSWRCRACFFNKNDVCNNIWKDLCENGNDYVQIKYGRKD